MLSGGRGGYVLDVDPEAIDALAVVRLADTARTLRNDGDAARAVQVCTQALAMFRGEIFADGGDGEWLMPHRTRWEELRLGLIEDVLASRLDLGAAADVVGELEALVDQHPMREGLWALLITALYRSGRPGDALAAYRRIKDQIADELGLDPGPELQAIEQRVLLRDPTLDRSAGPDPRRTPPPERPAAAATREPGNLPTLSAGLVGRQDEQGEITALLAGHRLVTLVGPAGVGKTRLAIEVARGLHHPDGEWLVRLENARTPAALPLAVGESLAIAGATEAMLIDRLRGSSLLLVLDNCEHLGDPVADLTDRLLNAAPGLTVLATSQMPLGIDGEQAYPVEPLPIADSVALFAQRAAERRKSFVLDPDAAATIEDLCRSLDGLPLAIELAAARTKALSVQEIARRLDDRFALLSDPASRRPERHRALGAAISWSYDLLFPDDQRGLWALACFSGGAPLAAAEHVVSALGVPADSAVDVIGRLADRSLVAVDFGDAGAVRYRLLDSVRAFALARLTESGDAEVAYAAHAGWIGAAADLAVAEQQGPRQVTHLALATHERANIDAALAWTAEHDPMLGLRIANAFGWTAVVLGEGAAAATRSRAALQAADHLAPADQRALALAYIGWNEVGGDIERATKEAERAVEVADTTDDPQVIAASRFSLAFALLHAGRPRASIELLRQWRADAADGLRPWDVTMGDVIVGYAGFAAGDVAAVLAAGEEAVPLLPAIGDDWLTSHVEAILGSLAQAEQRLPDAADHFRRAADAAHRVGASAAEGFHLANLGRVLQLSGDHLAAISTLEQGIEIIRAVGLMRSLALSRMHLGRLQREVGDLEAARSTIAAADAWFQASGGGDEAAVAQCLLAAMDAQDAVPGAAGRLAVILEKAEAANDLEVQVLALDALAGLRAAAGDLVGGTELLDRADALMAAPGHKLTEGDRLDADRARSLLDADDIAPAS